MSEAEFVYEQLDEEPLLEKGTKYVRTAAEWSTFTPVFLGLLAVGAFFHESHFLPTVIVMGVWLVLQILNNALEEDFQTDLFWGIAGVLFRIGGYLLAGVVWVAIKLPVEMLRGPLGQDLIKQYSALSDTLKGEALASAKFNLMLPTMSQWALTWPMNAMMVLTRSPLLRATELLFSLSEAYFVRAIDIAFGATKADSTWTPFWVAAYVLGYGVVGYGFSHLKLFFDVWQGTLPKKFEKQLLDGSYWEFVLAIKWMVMRWMITWPFEASYMVLRHPVRIAFETLYNLSMSKYAWITEKAMSMRNKKEN